MPTAVNGQLQPLNNWMFPAPVAHLPWLTFMIICTQLYRLQRESSNEKAWINPDFYPPCHDRVRLSIREKLLYH
jgi:hypothetical protein